MFCGVVNLVTASVQSEGKAVALIYVLGGAELLSLVGTRMLFRVKELGTRSTETDVVHPDHSSMPRFRSYSIPTMSTNVTWRCAKSSGDISHFEF